MYLQAIFILPLTGQPSTESALGKKENSHRAVLVYPVKGTSGSCLESLEHSTCSPYLSKP